ncbi:MAG: AAA family ATPase [Theionarchaea archaeon]|nr:AAA family ATPase [Theionarchaea archaeon]
MRFLSITLKNVRSFRSKTIEFRDGLNIVCGPNESGKSTILESILYAVAGEIEDVSSLRRWKSEDTSIHLRYKTDTGETYTVSRTISPEMKCRLENFIILEDPETILSTLRNHFGSIQKTVLESSAIVRHNQMEILRKMDSREIVKEQMRAALTGSETSTDEVITMLQVRIDEYQESLRDMDFKIENFKANLIPYAGVDEAYESLTSKIRVYEKDVKTRQREREMHTKKLLYNSTVKDVEEIQKRLEEIEDIESYREALPLEKIKKIEELENKRRRLEDGMESLISLIKEREEELVQIRKESDEKGFFSWFTSLFGKSKEKKDREKRAFTIEEVLKGYRRDFYELERKIEDMRIEKNDYINQIPDYKGKGVEYCCKVDGEYQKRIEELLKGLTKEELVQSLLRKREDADRLRGSIFTEYPHLLDMDDSDVTNERGNLEEMISMLKQEKEDSEAKFESVEIRKHEKERIQRELRALEAQNLDIKTRNEVDQVVLDTINEIYSELKDLFIPQLEEKAGQIMQRITKGKYMRILIGREDLGIRVELPDQLIDMKLLSQGTKDQLYFSLRIGLSELLSGGRNLPLLFDESFYTSDENRLKETFEVLEEIALNTQVILFTHNEDFLKYGNPIVLSEQMTLSDSVGLSTK